MNIEYYTKIEEESIYCWKNMGKSRYILGIIALGTNVRYMLSFILPSKGTESVKERAFISSIKSSTKKGDCNVNRRGVCYVEIH